MTKTIHVVARVVAQTETVEQIKSILINLVEPTRKEKGCIRYDLMQSLAQPTDFTFVEEWETEEDLNNHLASNHIKEAFRLVDGLLASDADIRRYSQIA